MTTMLDFAAKLTFLGMNLMTASREALVQRIVDKTKPRYLSDSEKSSYIPFSKYSAGHNGINILISPNLLPTYYFYIHSTSDSASSRRKIESLKSHGGHSIRDTFHSNFSNIDYVLNLKSASLFYKYQGGNIYIHRISPNYHSKSRTGLYSVEKSKTGDLNFKQSKNNALPHDNLYIAGESLSSKDAIETATKNVKPLLGEKFSLYYSSGDIIDSLGVWGQRENTNMSKEAIADIKNILIENKNKNRVTTITDTEGVEILGEALKSINQDLPNYKLLLTNPVGNIASTIESAERLKMSPLNESGYIGRFSKSNNLKKSDLSLFLNQKNLKTVTDKFNKRENATGSYVKKFSTEGQKVSSAFTQTKISRNFIDHLDKI